LIVFDHDGSEKSEVEDEFEDNMAEGDGGEFKKRSKGNFMSPDRLPPSTGNKINTLNKNLNIKSRNNEEIFTPNNALNKSKSKMSKTDLIKKKSLVENKSVDFKKSKKKKSSKKLSSLNG